ncbi:hypothetical protein vfu_A02243 [Vibrio furnissii NCTC 11218]|nr:hypothetical protein vfu_A02243 [Vibrio furnissii NCTC 11218]
MLYGNTEEFISRTLNFFSFFSENEVGVDTRPIDTTRAHAIRTSIR